ncbi:hypothetical protein SEA_NEDARYA_49 [Gordonia phage Nedarya]|nr:hypothetical protein SEA_NEDARYA_49 [Gordonia phage Nedarya]
MTTITDPFAAPAATEEPPFEPDVAQAPVETPKEETNVTVTKDRPAASSDGKVVLTFKGGAGFEAPWVVIHADGLDEASSFVNEDAGKLAELMTRVQKAAQHFAGQAPAKPAGGGGGSRGGAPQAAQEAPGGEERFCAHGKMTFRSGVAKGSGKPYKMFACPERDRSQQCDPQWLR